MSTLEVLAANGAWDHQAPINPVAPNLHQVRTPAASLRFGQVGIILPVQRGQVGATE
jgi:hypothetical protein